MCATARAREGQGVRNGLCTGGALRINSLSGAVCTGRVRNGVCARSTACAQRRVCKRGGGPAWQVACAQGLVRGGGGWGERATGCARGRGEGVGGVRNGLCAGARGRAQRVVHPGGEGVGGVRNGLCAGGGGRAQRVVHPGGGGCATGCARRGGGGCAQRVVRGGKGKMSSAGVSLLLLLLSHVRLKSRHAKKSHVSSSFRSPRPPQVNVDKISSQMLITYHIVTLFAAWIDLFVSIHCLFFKTFLEQQLFFTTECLQPLDGGTTKLSHLLLYCRWSVNGISQNEMFRPAVLNGTD